MTTILAGAFGVDTLMINQSLLYLAIDTLIGAASVTKATLRPSAFLPAADFGTDYVYAAIAEDGAPKAVTGANGPDFVVSNTVTPPPPIPPGNGGVLTLDFDVTGIGSRWVGGQWTNFGPILLDASAAARPRFTLEDHSLREPRVQQGLRDAPQAQHRAPGRLSPPHSASGNPTDRPPRLGCRREPPGDVLC